MVKIVIENLAQKVVSATDPGKSMLHHIHTAGVDWMHGCGAKGRCTTCKMIVLEGMINLSPPSAAEIRYRQAGQLAENERLACQTRTSGGVTIAVPEQSKLAHLTYSDTPGK
jgi:2Fe-2S ferredoxin